MIYRKLTFDTHTIYAKFNDKRVTYVSIYHNANEGFSINDCDFDTLLNVQPESGESSTKEEFEKNFVNAMIKIGVFDFYRIVGMAVKESVQNQIKVRNN